jgi:predicted O-methyltransferase YrrM
MGTLAVLASQCSRVAEFGVRTGNSTVALLYGLNQKPGTKLFSFDINDHSLDFDPKAEFTNVEWRFTKADTRNLGEMPTVDLLFIDTWHTYDQVKAELQYAWAVNRWIAFHDTVINRVVGDDGREGIWKAIDEFLSRNPDWKTLCHFTNCNGLTIIQRK